MQAAPRPSSAESDALPGHTHLDDGNELLYTPSLKHRHYSAAGGGRGRRGSASGAVHAGGSLPLSFSQKAAYSVGHFMNDSAAACWFSYLLLYLQQAQQLTGPQAGIVLFSGQLADAISTPLVGIFSDRSSGLPCLRLGRRKLFHFGGSILVLITFFFVFGICLPCEADGAAASSSAKTASFAVFAALFNVGWASVQVSHMALVPELSSDDGLRVWLNSARYGFTVLANIMVFLLMLGLLHWYNGGADSNDSNPAVYRLLAILVLSVGSVLSVWFLLGTPEKVGRVVALEAAGGGGAYSQLGASGDDDDEDQGHESGASSKGSAGLVINVTDEQPAAAQGEEAAGRRRGGASTTTAAPPPPSPVTLGGASRRAVMTWRDWLAMRVTYQVAAVYMFVRLATNVSQVYLSFFITQTLQMPQTALALIPMLVYISQLAATMGMKRISARFSRVWAMTLGGACFAGACAVMAIVPSSAAGVLYPTSILLGFGSAISMVISVSLEADLVGSNIESGAFVYGCISFTDKLSNGAVVLAIQYAGDALVGDSPAHASDTTPARADFVRYVNAIVPAAAMVLAILVAWMIRFPKAEAAVAAPVEAAGSSSGSKRSGGVTAMRLASATTASGHSSDDTTTSLLSDDSEDTRRVRTASFEVSSSAAVVVGGGRSSTSGKLGRAMSNLD